MIAEPLRDRMIGAVEASFVVAEWTDPGAPPLKFRIGEEIEAPAGSAVLAPPERMQAIFEKYDSELVE